MKRDKEKTISIDKDVHKRIKIMAASNGIHLKLQVKDLIDFFESTYNVLVKENEDLKKQIAVMNSEYVEAWEKITKLESLLNNK